MTYAGHPSVVCTAKSVKIAFLKDVSKLDINYFLEVQYVIAGGFTRRRQSGTFAASIVAASWSAVFDNRYIRDILLCKTGGVDIHSLIIMERYFSSSAANNLLALTHWQSTWKCLLSSLQ